MHSNNTNELLKLKGVKVKKIQDNGQITKIYLESKPKLHTCPACGTETKRIHDYRIQVIKLIYLSL